VSVLRRSLYRWVSWAYRLTLSLSTLRRQLALEIGKLVGGGSGGVSGASGRSGTSGRSGYSGSSGASGRSGYSGYSGIAPENVVTTDTDQSIDGSKTFNGAVQFGATAEFLGLSTFSQAVDFNGQEVRLNKAGAIGTVWHWDITGVVGATNVTVSYTEGGGFTYSAPGIDASGHDVDAILSGLQSGGFPVEALFPIMAVTHIYTIQFTADGHDYVGPLASSVGTFTLTQAAAVSGGGALLMDNGTIQNAAYLMFKAQGSAPTTLDTKIRVYQSGSKIVYQYKDSGTVRYKYLDMAGTGVTWVHTTSAP
jgi:hypothetical protein